MRRVSTAPDPDLRHGSGGLISEWIPGGDRLICGGQGVCWCGSCTMSLVEVALDALADTSPREYLRRSGGRSLLHILYAQCESAGLIAGQGDADDVARLHALFSVATAHGMNLAVDYITEVCCMGAQGVHMVPADDGPGARGPGTGGWGRGRCGVVAVPSSRLPSWCRKRAVCSSVSSPRGRHDVVEGVC